MQLVKHVTRDFESLEITQEVTNPCHLMQIKPSPRLSSSIKHLGDAGETKDFEDSEISESSED